MFFSLHFILFCVSFYHCVLCRRKKDLTSYFMQQTLPFTYYVENVIRHNQIIVKIHILIALWNFFTSTVVWCIQQTFVARNVSFYSVSIGWIWTWDKFLNCNSSVWNVHCIPQIEIECKNIFSNNLILSL